MQLVNFKMHKYNYSMLSGNIENYPSYKNSIQLIMCKMTDYNYTINIVQQV